MLVVALTFIFGLLFVAFPIIYDVQRKDFMAPVAFLFWGYYTIRIPLDLLKLRYRSWVLALIFWGGIWLFGALTTLLCGRPNTDMDMDFGAYHFPSYAGVAMSLSILTASTLSLWILLQRNVRRRFMI
jgi:hypothetical protein